MRELRHLFENNRAWAQNVAAENPSFFEGLSRQQAPQYFWIGCSDSRVPANQITGLMPGEMFVHRNVANVVSPKDLNGLSALQFAIDILKVRHVIVCGHYGCGGVRAVEEDRRLGLVGEWLEKVQEVRRKHADQLILIPDLERRIDRLCELNVVEQVRTVTGTKTVQDAWQRCQPLTIHGWIYSVSDGLLRDLDVCISGAGDAGNSTDQKDMSPEPQRGGMPGPTG